MPPNEIEIEIGNSLGISPYKYKFTFKKDCTDVQYFNLDEGRVGSYIKIWLLD